ncbi:MAG: type I polyketide synthase [Leptolyngbya sp. SIO3F4]|nr:type I polyketide synthase [Leptolyngbya sp. SIO3F4]
MGKLSTVEQSQRVLLALKEARAKLEANERSQNEAIAIVGMGCRLPGGANDPTSLWQLLIDGKDAITEVPADRWNVDEYYDPDVTVPGKMYARHGGFLTQVDCFDAKFFGISPREAVKLDPQQRLLLEVSWEALERAGIVTNSTNNHQTGVFVGITTNDYARLLMPGDDRSQIDAYYLTGNPLNAVAGRLSYTLGLQGPCMVIDTACSSSLVALHLACQSLRNRECDQALAGGVNLILAPENSIALSKAQMLSRDGRCKTFDAAADGIVRGEGCGIVVLKRLSDAQKAGDRILALIRGSAINQDGASGGFTVPSKSAQEALMYQALNRARVSPGDISYVEAHGTGTPLGDPIEVRALATVYGKEHAGLTPLSIGSIKTNIGHLEAAAGIAGVMKVVLALQNQVMPPHLHLKQLNPHINWNELPITVTTQAIPWPTGDRPRFAGVSAFGASGTNAHLILEEAPSELQITKYSPEVSLNCNRLSTTKASAAVATLERSAHLLAISAKSGTALAQLAENYAQHLITHSEQSLADICFTANTGRSHFSHRLCLLVKDSHSAVQQLLTIAKDSHTVTRLQASDNVPAIAIIVSNSDEFPVQACQSLYQTQLTFRTAYDRYQTALAELPPLSANQKLWVCGQLALYTLWCQLGIEPSLIVGAGSAFYIASHIAGVLSLADMVRLLSSDDSGVAIVADISEHSPTSEHSPAIPLMTIRQGLWTRLTQLTIDDLNQPSPQTLLSDTNRLDLGSQGCHIAMSLGAHSTTVPQDVCWLTSLSIDDDGSLHFLNTVATLYQQGCAINWTIFDAGYMRHHVSLPTYPWQKQRYWLDSPAPDQHNRSLTNGNGQTSVPQPFPPTTIALKSLTAVDIQIWLATQISQELGIPIEQIDIHTRFDSYGLDSILILSIAAAGQQFLGIEVSPLLLMHYPTIASLAQYLAEKLETDESEIFEL